MQTHPLCVSASIDSAGSCLVGAAQFGSTAIRVTNTNSSWKCARSTDCRIKAKLSILFLTLPKPLLWSTGCYEIRLQSDNTYSLLPKTELSVPLLTMTENCTPIAARPGCVRVCLCLRCRDSYHAGSHAGLPAAEPRHGRRDRHLWWCKGDGAGLGDVGVRGAMVDVVRAAKQNTTATRHWECSVETFDTWRTHQDWVRDSHTQDTVSQSLTGFLQASQSYIWDFLRNFNTMQKANEYLCYDHISQSVKAWWKTSSYSHEAG